MSAADTFMWDPHHLVHMTSAVVPIYNQSIQEIWNAYSQGSHTWYYLHVWEGWGWHGGRAQYSRFCLWWELITWCSPLSDVISMTRPSIVSLPWTPRESCLHLPLSLLRVGFIKSDNHHTPIHLSWTSSTKCVKRTRKASNYCSLYIS